MCDDDRLTGHFKEAAACKKRPARKRKLIMGVTQKEEAQEIRLTEPPKTPSGR